MITSMSIVIIIIVSSSSSRSNSSSSSSSSSSGSNSSIIVMIIPLLSIDAIIITFVYVFSFLPVCVGLGPPSGCCLFTLCCWFSFMLFSWHAC